MIKRVEYSDGEGGGCSRKKVRLAFCCGNGGDRGGDRVEVGAMNKGDKCERKTNGTICD